MALTSSSTLSSLKLVNLLLALSYRCAGVPDPVFYRHGYRNRYVEAELITLKGDIVVPDVILHGKAANHSLAFDAKGSEKYMKESQLRKYSGLTPRDVVRGLGVPLDSPQAHTLNVTLVAAACHASAACAMLAAFPQIGFLSVDDPPPGLMRLECGPIANPALEAELQSGVPVPADLPTHLCPFDPHDASVLLPKALNALLVMERKRLRRFGIDDLLFIVGPRFRSKTCVLDDSFKRKIRKDLRGILREAMRGELKRFLQKVDQPNKPALYAFEVPIPMHVQTRRSFQRALRTVAADLSLPQRLLSLQLELPFWGTEDSDEEAGR